MKKIIIFIGILSFIMTGCMTYHNSVPDDMTRVEMVAKIDTSYKILGPTEGQGEAIRVLGFWVGGPAKRADNMAASAPGTVSGLMAFMASFGGAKDRAEKAAAYAALENFPGADRVIDPKWKTEVDDYFIYVRAVSTVSGTAVQFSHQ